MTTAVKSNADGTSTILNGAIPAIEIAADGKVAFPKNLQTKIFIGVMPLGDSQAMTWPSGVSPSKYVALTAIVEANNNTHVTPGDPNAKISVCGNAGDIGVFIIPGGSTNDTLYGQPVKATLTYEP